MILFTKTSSCEFIHLYYKSTNYNYAYWPCYADLNFSIVHFFSLLISILRSSYKIVAGLG